MTMDCELQDKCELYGDECQPRQNAGLVGCSGFKKKTPTSCGQVDALVRICERLEKDFIADGSKDAFLHHALEIIRLGGNREEVIYKIIAHYRTQEKFLNGRVKYLDEKVLTLESF